MFDGGVGDDNATFEDALAGVVVNLLTGQIANDGFGNAETITNVENLFGSVFGDSLTLGNGNAFVFARAGNDTVTGGSGNNTIYGGSGNDSLNGGGGTDLVSYSAETFDTAGAVTQGVVVNLATGTATDNWGGTDTLAGFENVVGGSMNDSLTGNTEANNLAGLGGNDTLLGGDGQDFLDGGLDNDSLSGGDGNDVLFGGEGNDTLLGGDGVDALWGSGGIDVYDGGVGDDNVSFEDALVGVVVDLLTGQIANDGFGNAETITNVENLFGSAFGDSLTLGNGSGFSLTPYVFARAGNDTVTGGSGNNNIYGGSGNDSLDGGGGTDMVSYNAETFDTAGAVTQGVVVNLATGIATDNWGGTDTLAGFENITGSSLNDSLTGNAESNELNGGGGNDTLSGGEGADFLRGNAGTDVYDGGSGSDVVFFEDALGGVVVNLLTGQIANDGFGNAETITSVENLHGGAFGDSLTLGNGTAYVFARAGNDTVIGGSGSNNIYGGSGNDSLDGGGGTDTANYSAETFDTAGAVTQGVVVNLATGTATDNWGGTDTLAGFENATGGSMNDSLTGNAAFNFLDGGSGNDTLLGGDGEDTLRGGAGDDVLDGQGNVPSANFDYADYRTATSGVTVNLLTGTASGTNSGNDSLIGIEGVFGSAFDDNLTGAGTADIFFGGAGNDTIDGGAGFDLVAYSTENLGAIVANLATGQVSGAYGNDVLSGVEGLIGGSFGDVLIGDDNGNFLRGGFGNDTIDGGAGIDRAAFDIQNAGPVTASLVTGLATGGSDNDVLINIENLRGGNFGDNLEGNDGANDIQGRGGNDTITGLGGNDSLFGEDGNDSLLGGAGADFVQGGAGDDTMDGGALLDLINLTDGNSLSYASSTSAISLNTATGTASDGLGGNDQFTNFSFYTGSSFNDLMVGRSGGPGSFEQFEGGLGDDTIDGGAITDLQQLADANRASYQSASGAVTVNLATGSSSGAAGNDTLININFVRGSNFGDLLIGSNRTDVGETFEGRAGADTIDGAGGYDQIRYNAATSGVNVNLATGIAQDGTGSTDTFSNIEDVRGSAFDDVLTGGNAANGVGLREGIEDFQGDAGNDAIDGGQGFDRISFDNSLAGVRVSFTGAGSGTAEDGYGTIDTFVNVEGVRGSEFDDTLTGSDAGTYERFEGRTGNDVIDGRGGFDVADYSTARSAVSASLLTGSAQDGYGSTDTLSNIEGLNGGRFADTLIGNSAVNELRGNEGNDTLTGQAGGDVFFFDLAGNGIDTITDWGAGDRVLVSGGIQLAGISAGNGATVSGRRVEVSANGGITDLWIDTDNNTGAEVQVRLDGTHAASSFFFVNGPDGAAIVRLVDVLPTVAAQLPDTVATADSAFSLTVPGSTFADPEGQPLSLSATLSGGAALPAWLSFDAATNTLSGTPGADAVGVFNLSVRATDATNLNASDDFQLIVAPAGFNALNYIASYADLRSVFGLDQRAATRHFVESGRFEGRTVSFDPLRYLASNPDLISFFGLNTTAAATHYIGSGNAEGRQLSFDALRYIASNPDLITSFGLNTTVATSHYIANGYAEGRQVGFDALRYIASNPDLIASFGLNTTVATSHYIANGYAEGRQVGFDALRYIASNPDLIASLGLNATAATTHYIANGYAENRQVDFDALRYIASNPDLIAVFGLNPTAATTHYVSSGYAEGRVIDFDAAAYLAQHADLQAAFGNDLVAATRHYISSGAAEGRQWRPQAQAILAVHSPDDAQLAPQLLAVGGAAPGSDEPLPEPMWFGIAPSGEGGSPAVSDIRLDDSWILQATPDTTTDWLPAAAWTRTGWALAAGRESQVLAVSDAR